jgi:hypothetical protein
MTHDSWCVGMSTQGLALKLLFSVLNKELCWVVNLLVFIKVYKAIYLLQKIVLSFKEEYFQMLV